MTGSQNGLPTARPPTPRRLTVPLLNGAVAEYETDDVTKPCLSVRSSLGNPTVAMSDAERALHARLLGGAPRRPGSEGTTATSRTHRERCSGEPLASTIAIPFPAAPPTFQGVNR
jgi:hypothetical protein